MLLPLPYPKHTTAGVGSGEETVHISWMTLSKVTQPWPPLVLVL